MEKQKRLQLDSWLLRAFFVLSLLFPIFYSPYTDVYQSAYYGGFSWAYFFLACYLGVRLWKGLRERRRFSVKGKLYLGMLLVYNVFSFYFNYKYLHWYWEQINNTVAFLTFGVLVFCRTGSEPERQDNVRVLIHCIVFSNLASIVCYFLGYTKIMICNHQFVVYGLPGDFYETRHYWLYSHKSEYALMLVAFIALFVAYREKFRNWFTYLCSVTLLLFCLYLSHSWTGIICVALIFAGELLDRADWKKFRWKKRYLLVSGGAVLAAAGVASRILAERNVFSLGGRPQIWAAAWRTIQKYPEGWGMRFGESAMEVAEGWLVNNAHNVFLNAVLRFSILSGICFTVLFLGIVIFTVVKSRSWLVAGMWMALLLLLNMDYSLMSLQMALLFFVVYLVCISRKRMKSVG